MKKILAVVSVGAVAICCGGAAETGVTDGADAGGEGGASSDAAGANDGARGAPGAVVADGGTGAEAGAPGGTTSTLLCGSATCLIPTESCCLSSVNSTFAFACVVGATCPAASGSGDGGGNGQNGDTASLKCTSAANCAAGTVCCVSAPNNGATSECKPSCAPMDAQLCDPAAATTGCAPAEPCSSRKIDDWGLPPTFGTCGGKGN